MKNEVKEGVLVITLEGNLLGEHTNAPVMELIKQNLEAGNKKVVFNLEGLKYMTMWMVISLVLQLGLLILILLEWQVIQVLQF